MPVAALAPMAAQCRAMLAALRAEDLGPGIRPISPRSCSRLRSSPPCVRALRTRCGPDARGKQFCGRRWQRHEGDPGGGFPGDKPRLGQLRRHGHTVPENWRLLGRAETSPHTEGPGRRWRLERRPHARRAACRRPPWQHTTTRSGPSAAPPEGLASRPCGKLGCSRQFGRIRSSQKDGRCRRSNRPGKLSGARTVLTDRLWRVVPPRPPKG